LADQIIPEDVIEMSIKEQKISLYIVPNVPEDFEFETRTRKEISVSVHQNGFDIPLTLSPADRMVQIDGSSDMEA
jgi:hypothetical protein